MQKQLRKGRNLEGNQQFKEQKAAEFVQRRLKGILGRKECTALRAEEMIFLGMERSPKKPDEEDEIEKREQMKSEAKAAQLANQEKYNSALKSLKEEIINVEGYDTKDE